MDTRTDRPTPARHDATRGGIGPGAPSVDDLVDLTPGSRDRTVDLLRALSIAVVVVWHWSLSVTHWSGGSLVMPNPIGHTSGLWLATWVFQVMPLFFMVGGFSNLAALDGHGRAGGTTVGYLRSRSRRLLRPTAVMAGVWAALDLVRALLLPDVPSVLEWGAVVFVPLWFVGVYSVAVLLSPWTARAHRWCPSLALVGLGSAIALGDLGRLRFGIDELGLLTSALVFLFAHQLGYVWRDGLVSGRRHAAAVAAGGLAALVLLTNIGVYPRSMVAVPGEWMSNMFPTTAPVAALAVFQLGLVLLAAPTLRRWLERRSVWKATVVANSFAMTVFCWHMTALVLAIGVFQAFGGELEPGPTTTWWLTRPLWLLLPALALAPLVAAFARFERPTPTLTATGSPLHGVDTYRSGGRRGGPPRPRA